MTVGVEGAADLLVDPVLLLVVPHAPVQGPRGADQQEVTRGANVVQQTLVKLPGLKTMDVQEDGVHHQLQVNLQQTCQPRPVRSSVADEYVHILL